MLNLELAKHCQLCEHQIINFDRGSLCELTDSNPDFVNTCPNIKFGNKLEKSLVEINISHQRAKKAKPLAYVMFIFFLLLSMAIMVGGYLLGKYVLSAGVISGVPIVLFGVGVVVLQLGFGPFNKWKSDWSLASEKKSRVDSILAMYKVGYEIDIEFGKTYHGHQDIDVDLRMKKL